MRRTKISKFQTRVFNKFKCVRVTAVNLYVMLSNNLQEAHCSGIRGILIWRPPKTKINRARSQIGGRPPLIASRVMLFWCRLQPANPDLFIGNTRDFERKHRQTLRNPDILILIFGKRYLRGYFAARVYFKFFFRARVEI